MHNACSNSDRIRINIDCAGCTLRDCMRHRILHLLPGTALVSSAGLVAGVSFLNVSPCDTSHNEAQGED